MLQPVVADTFQLGQNPVADIVIRGFNSGEYSYPGDKVIKLNQENRIVIVKVLEEPHPMELNLIYPQVYADYQNSIKANFTDNLQKKYTLKISNNAETILKESY